MNDDPWTIEVAGSAGRQLAERLPENVATACIEFIKVRVGAQLRVPLEGQWRARRGTYRVRYRVDEEKRLVYVLDVEHRRDAYRR